MAYQGLHKIDRGCDASAVVSLRHRRRVPAFDVCDDPLPSIRASPTPLPSPMSTLPYFFFPHPVVVLISKTAQEEAFGMGEREGRGKPDAAPPGLRRGGKLHDIYTVGHPLLSKT